MMEDILIEDDNDDILDGYMLTIEMMVSTEEIRKRNGEWSHVVTDVLSIKGLDPDNNPVDFTKNQGIRNKVEDHYHLSKSRIYLHNKVVSAIETYAESLYGEPAPYDEDGK